MKNKLFIVSFVDHPSFGYDGKFSAVAKDTYNVTL